jgi:hypothetical protein
MVLMFKPAAAVGPVCPMCKEPGIHGSEQKCIDNFRAEIDKLRRHIANLPKDPAVQYLGRWVPSFVP